MILEKKQDKKGAYYRLGMIERTALTLENFASSGFGSRFYTEEFLEGLLARRNEVHAKAGKTFAGMILLSTLLAFFDNIHGTTSVLGLTVDIPPSGASALSVLVSLSLLASVLALIDQLLIDRFVSTLGNRCHIPQGGMAVF